MGKRGATGAGAGREGCAGGGGAGAGAEGGESSWTSSSVEGFTKASAEHVRIYAFITIQTMNSPANASLLRLSSEDLVNAKAEDIVRLCLGGDLLVWAGDGFNFY